MPTMVAIADLTGQPGSGLARVDIKTGTLDAP
jgi:hypothetical protein